MLNILMQSTSAAGTVPASTTGQPTVLPGAFAALLAGRTPPAPVFPDPFQRQATAGNSPAPQGGDASPVFTAQAKGAVPVRPGPSTQDPTAPERNAVDGDVTPPPPVPSVVTPGTIRQASADVIPPDATGTGLAEPVKRPDTGAMGTPVASPSITPVPQEALNTAQSAPAPLAAPAEPSAPPASGNGAVVTRNLAPPIPTAQVPTPAVPVQATGPGTATSPDGPVTSQVVAAARPTSPPAVMGQGPQTAALSEPAFSPPNLKATRPDAASAPAITVAWPQGTPIQTQPNAATPAVASPTGPQVDQSALPAPQTVGDTPPQIPGTGVLVGSKPDAGLAAVPPKPEAAGPILAEPPNGRGRATSAPQGPPTPAVVPAQTVSSAPVQGPAPAATVMPEAQALAATPSVIAPAAAPALPRNAPLLTRLAGIQQRSTPLDPALPQPGVRTTASAPRPPASPTKQADGAALTVPSSTERPIPEGGAGRTETTAPAPSPKTPAFLTSAAQAVLTPAQPGTPASPLDPSEFRPPEVLPPLQPETAALARPTPVQELTPKPAPRPFSEAILAQVRAVEVTEGRTTVNLHPRGLGTIEVEVIADKDIAAKVVVRVENPAVLQALRDERQFLAQSIGVSDQTEFEFHEHTGEQKSGGGAEQGTASGSTSGLRPDAAEDPQHRNIVDAHQLDIMT